MLTSPRKSRSLQPSVLTLESIQAASNLVPWIPFELDLVPDQPHEKFETTSNFVIPEVASLKTYKVLHTSAERSSSQNSTSKILTTAELRNAPEQVHSAYIVSLPKVNQITLTTVALRAPTPSSSTNQTLQHGGDGVSSSSNNQTTPAPYSSPVPDPDTIRPMSVAVQPQAESIPDPQGTQPPEPPEVPGGTPVIAFSGGMQKINGAYYDVVGDLVELEIQPHPGSKIVQAKVTVQNAIGSPVQYSNEEGSAPVLAPNTEADVVDLGASAQAVLSFNWNGTPGTNRIDVSVRYDGNPAFFDANVSVIVVAPTIHGNTFQDVQQAFQFGQYGQVFGFHQSTTNAANQPVEGNVITASVDMPKVGAVAVSSAEGEFAFLQTAIFTIGTTTRGGVQPSFTNVKDGQNNPIAAVDEDGGNAGGQNAIFIGSYVSDPLVPAGTQNKAIGPATDSPGYLINTNNFPGNNTITQLSYDSTFTTYLMYHAKKGIWVGIGKLPPWSVKGARTYAGPFNANSPGDYTNTGNWTVNIAETPAVGSTIVGANWNGIPTWTKSTQLIFKPPPP